WSGEKPDICGDSIVILVLAGVWLIWFLTLRPLGVRLERNYREIREKNASLAFQANHDTLTGLLNRTAFMQHMNALGRSGHLHEQTALILADVDNFKSINDNHGHHAGDRVLMEFARRLGLEQGDNESLYRLSGDEFAVVMTAVSGRQQVVARAEQILRNLRQKITLSGSGYDLPISGSLGGAWGRSCGASLEEMFSAADMALHHVKNNGRNHFALFDEVSGLAISHILEMEQELYQAVEQRAFVLYYQPIVDIRDNALIRLEALLRWRHPQRGILEPERWMPVAERLSILSEINLQVFDILEQDIRRWQAMNLACVPVNINITESLLLSGLVVDRIRELMQEPGMACHIGIEVTESVILDRSIKLARSQLERIRAAGIHIALDDFGTGFANLSHLNSIPYDAIKIDQSFVRIIPEDRGMRLIIESMIALLERLGKEVVCEGVENETVRDLLIRMGCRYSQGFLHARPLPFEQVCHWLKHRGVGHE
ncbi:MAG TPA: EAL domain-containing protein, partial [Thiolinea sp.]|nr:EAL domain-containing protein [Thiolinea sp.]